MWFRGNSGRASILLLYMLMSEKFSFQPILNLLKIPCPNSLQFKSTRLNFPLSIIHLASELKDSFTMLLCPTLSVHGHSNLISLPKANAHWRRFNDSPEPELGSRPSQHCFSIGHFQAFPQDGRRAVVVQQRGRDDGQRRRPSDERRTTLSRRPQATFDESVDVQARSLQARRRILRFRRSPMKKISMFLSFVSTLLFAEIFKTSLLCFFIID